MIIDLIRGKFVFIDAYGLWTIKQKLIPDIDRMLLKLAKPSKHPHFDLVCVCKDCIENYGSDEAKAMLKLLE